MELPEHPADELAERAVLGAMIKDPDNIPIVLEYLREEDFYFETHRLLFVRSCRKTRDGQK
jgi:replicative DNA helicase